MATRRLTVLIAVAALTVGGLAAKAYAKEHHSKEVQSTFPTSRSRSSTPPRQHRRMQENDRGTVRLNESLPLGCSRILNRILLNSASDLHIFPAPTAEMRPERSGSRVLKRSPTTDRNVRTG